jgi:hypothetical protein
MKVLAATIVVALLACISTLARADSGIPIGSGPGGVPFGAGTQRGVAGLNNSGQTGFVTLFDRGARTAVVVAIEGSKHRLERVTIQRGTSCDAIGARTAARLNDLTAGISRSYVPMPIAKLMSGNYVTVVYSSLRRDAHPVACGELYS